MSVVYHRVGTTLRLSWQYPNNATTMTTGKVAGNFTLKIVKNGTGNQATTGCTFAEIDATNDPGMYEYACSGSTSFASATADYDIGVYDSSDFTKLWGTKVMVTSDGTGAGSWGDASFTATAANGRIMAGGVPLADATIYIVNSSGVLYNKTTSGATGLWGPVYFSTAGTYTVYAQKSGYSSTSGTITVVGSVATGPGSDLTLTASSTAGSLLASTFLGFIRRSSQDRSGALADTEAIEILNDAVDMIAMERQWDYYHTRGAVQTQAKYETGTIALTYGSTTCTLTTGTWPTWAASGEIFVNGTWVVVASRTSGSVLVLEDPWGNDSVTASSYTLVQFRYALPADCIRISDTMFGSQWPFVSRPTSASYIESMKDAWQSTNSQPFMWAIEGAFLCLWPCPETQRNINMLYFRRPTPVASGGDTIDWDSQHPFLLRRAIEYVVAMRRKADSDEKIKAQSVAKKVYDDSLAKAYVWDKTAADPASGEDGMRGAYGDSYLFGNVDP